MMRQCLSELCGAAQIRPPGLASRRILRERGEGSEGSEGRDVSRIGQYWDWDCDWVMCGGLVWCGVVWCDHR